MKEEERRRQVHEEKQGSYQELVEAGMERAQEQLEDRIFKAFYAHQRDDDRFQSSKGEKSQWPNSSQK